MKKFIVLFVAVMAMFATTAKAQSSLLATLNHEGTISTFYGTNALQQAHAAAANGDVITLSSGTFQSVDITKTVTLRGAGMALDAATQTEPTVLANDFTIDIPDETTQRLTIEGIYTNQTVTINKLKNAMFLKDRFRYFFFPGSAYGKDLTFIHCRITEGYNGNSNSNNSGVFQNCLVRGMQGTNYIFNNCLFLAGTNTSNNHCGNSEYRNCIILNSLNTNSTSTYYNNLYCKYGPYSFNVTNNTNVEVAEDNEAIKNLFGYSDDNEYKLTEAAKALIKGSDGTEVGVYGGSLPYDPTPTNPQISKFNVAAKTTADGKLSVDIEVKSAE